MTFGLSGAALGGLIAAGGTVAGSMIASNGAKSAANSQSAAADRGIAAQQAQFDKVQQLLNPFVTAAIGQKGGEFDGAEYLRLYPDVANNAVYGNNPYQHYLDYGRSEGRTMPLTQAKPGALSPYLDLLGVNGAQAQQAGIDGIQGGAEFGSLAKQGQDALLQAASATGGLRGGNTENALATFRSNLLSSLIDKQIGRLGGVVQLGQNSAAGVGSAALQTGQGVSNLIQQQGAAVAGGQLAGGNLLGGAIANVGGLIAGRTATAPVPAPTAMSAIGGGGGFGSGVVYGNQDLGQYF